MSTPTKPQERVKKVKQWAWFIGIWAASLLTVLTLGYGIKFLMKLI